MLQPKTTAYSAEDINSTASAMSQEPTPIPPVLPPSPPPPQTEVTQLPALSSGSPRISGVNITFYDCANQGFCGHMYNGRPVYEGAAACSWNLAIGTRFVIDGDPTSRVYTCEDRGLLADTWVDIFWYYPSQGHSWQSQVGRYGTIELVE